LLPVYLHEPTTGDAAWTSRSGHFRTCALQQRSNNVRCIHVPAEKVSTGPIADGLGGAFECNRLDAAYLFERRQVAGAVPNAFLKAREKAASEL
jgi:hypothetical protein